MKPFDPLLDRLPPADLCTIPNWVVWVLAAAPLAVAVLLMLSPVIGFFVIEQDRRGPFVIIWLTAWLLPWPGRPGLLRRMALSSAVGLVALGIVFLYLRYGWFTGLVELFLP